jgi:hypothetical protein
VRRRMIAEALKERRRGNFRDDGRIKAGWSKGGIELGFALEELPPFFLGDAFEGDLPEDVLVVVNALDHEGDRFADGAAFPEFAQATAVAFPDVLAVDGDDLATTGDREFGWEAGGAFKHPVFTRTDESEKFGRTPKTVRGKARAFAWFPAWLGLNVERKFLSWLCRRGDSWGDDEAAGQRELPGGDQRYDAFGFFGDDHFVQFVDGAARIVWIGGISGCCGVGEGDCGGGEDQYAEASKAKDDEHGAKESGGVHRFAF